MTQSQQYSSYAARIVKELTYAIAVGIHGLAYAIGLVVLGGVVGKYLAVLPATAGALLVAGAMNRVLYVDDVCLLDRLLLSLGVMAPLYLLGVSISHRPSDPVVGVFALLIIISGVASMALEWLTGDEAGQDDGTSEATVDGSEEVTI